MTRSYIKVCSSAQAATVQFQSYFPTPITQASSDIFPRQQRSPSSVASTRRGSGIPVAAAVIPAGAGASHSGLRHARSVDLYRAQLEERDKTIEALKQAAKVRKKWKNGKMHACCNCNGNSQKNGAS